MWAHRLIAPARLEPVEVDPLDPAALRPGEVLARFLAGAICGSDLPGFLGRPNPVLPDVHGSAGYPLHELVGEVVATRAADVPVGARIVGWAEGMRGLAELYVARGDSVLVLDDGLPSIPATVVQPLSTVLYSLDRVGDVAGRRAAVIGQGPLGLLFSHALKARGAAHVTGVDVVDRRDDGPAFGVDEVVWEQSASWAATLHPDRRPDVVIEAVGHQVGTFTDALEAVGFGGRVFAFGVPDDHSYPIPFVSFFRKNLTLMSGVALDRRKSLEQSRAYLASHPGLTERYITHTLPVSEAQRAFELAVVPSPGRLKVALDGTT
jgi:threonine dehydrogenase-like Zn-dependent dehydrogenase